MMTKQEVVKATLAHQDVEEVPYLINFTPDAQDVIQSHFPGMDIYKLKAQYGSRLTFWGGISTQQTLPYGTPDEVQAEIDQVVACMSQGGGYITAPAQYIQTDVPLENMLALIEQARSYA